MTRSEWSTLALRLIADAHCAIFLREHFPLAAKFFDGYVIHVRDKLSEYSQ